MVICFAAADPLEGFVSATKEIGLLKPEREKRKKKINDEWDSVFDYLRQHEDVKNKVGAINEMYKKTNDEDLMDENNWHLIDKEGYAYK